MRFALQKQYKSFNPKRLIVRLLCLSNALYRAKLAHLRTLYATGAERRINFHLEATRSSLFATSDRRASKLEAHSARLALLLVNLAETFLRKLRSDAAWGVGHDERTFVAIHRISEDSFKFSKIIGGNRDNLLESASLCQFGYLRNGGRIASERLARSWVLLMPSHTSDAVVQHNGRHGRAVVLRGKDPGNT